MAKEAAGCGGCKGSGDGGDKALQLQYGGLAATSRGGVISSSKSGPLDVGVGTERWGRDGAPSTMSLQVDLA
jgi:hypothetical protein